MGCSCINGWYDFDLIYSSCKKILYIDRSVWMVGKDFSSPQYILTVTNEGGYSKQYEYTGTPLYLDFGDCPTPGTYTFSVETCGEPFQKRKALLCTLQCGYLRAVAKIDDLHQDLVTSIRERINQIDHLVSHSDFLTASELTDTVVRDLKRINCDCSC